MDQRHEDFAVPLLEVPDNLFDGSGTAGIAVFIAQSIEDAPLGMPPFAVNVSVLAENLLDDPDVGPDLPLGTRLALPVGRLDMLQNLDQRVLVDAESTAHAPLAVAFDEDESSNLALSAEASAQRGVD